MERSRLVVDKVERLSEDKVLDREFPDSSGKMMSAVLICFAGMARVEPGQIGPNKVKLQVLMLFRNGTGNRSEKLGR